MTPVELLARIEADLRVRHALDQAERPEGLTASQFYCLNRMARAILRCRPGSEGDVWRAGRGTAVHEWLGEVLSGVDPGYLDGRKAERFSWHPDPSLPEVTGLWDGAFRDDEADVIVEFKTADRDFCRRRKIAGPEPGHAMQVAMGADAEGFRQAFLVYLPTNAGWDDAVALEVDIRFWLGEARLRIEQADVRGEVNDLLDQGVNLAEAQARVLDGVPREPPYDLCALTCAFFKDCRGDYRPPPDLEIVDPVLRRAALDYEQARADRLDAQRRETAAKADLRHAEGTVHDERGDLRVSQVNVAATKTRRRYTATRVDRRPE